MYPAATRALRAATIAALFCLSAPLAQARLAELTSEDAMAEIMDLAINDLLSTTGDGGDADGPVLGMPKADQIIRGRMDVWMNPKYWETYVREFVYNGNVQIPSPTDVVKPELWTDNVHVGNDPGYVSPIYSNVSEVSGFGNRTYRWNGEDKTTQEFMITTESDVVLFLVDGTIVGELYNNGYNPEVRHQPWSVTKTFIAALVGVAYDEGLIDSLDDPIEKYIPELALPPSVALSPTVYTQNPAAWEDELQPGNRPHTEWKGVSVEDVLQMESGVHWDEDTPFLALNTQVQQWIMVLLDHYTDGALGMTRNEFLAQLPDAYRSDRTPKEGEQGDPDAVFSYNSGNTQVLAWMLENLYGDNIERDDAGNILSVGQPKPFNEIVSEKLWQPMGAYRDAKMIADRVGGVIASQGLYSRPYDFARFGEILRNIGSNSDGIQVLPSEWIAQMTDMENPTSRSEGRYAYQTWASTAGRNAYKASGFQGQKITVVPERCVTAVRMSHSFGLDYRDGEDMQDPDAYGFSTNFSADEWALMVQQLSEQFGASCDDAREKTRYWKQRHKAGTGKR